MGLLTRHNQGDKRGNALWHGTLVDFPLRLHRKEWGKEKRLKVVQQHNLFMAFIQFIYDKLQC